MGIEPIGIKTGFWVVSPIKIIWNYLGVVKYNKITKKRDAYYDVVVNVSFGSLFIFIWYLPSLLAL